MGMLLAGSPSAPAAEKTSTVVYKFDSEDALALPIGHEILIQATMPLAPKAAVPELCHPVSGERCDVIPMAWDATGQPDMFQIVSRHVVDGTEPEITFTTQPAGGAVDPGIQYLDTGFGGVTFTKVTTSGVVFSLQVADMVQKRVWRTGNFCDEREFWGRMTGPLGEKGPGIRLFLDRRADWTALFTIFVENTLWTPTTANLTGVDQDQTGEVFYDQLYFDGLPVNHHAVEMEIEEAHQDISIGTLVKPENTLEGSGNEHLLPIGAEYPHHFVVRRANVFSAAARSIGKHAGYGFPYAGDYHVGAARGYGSSRLPGMDFTDSRIDHEGYAGTGLANTLARDQAKVDALRSDIQNGIGNWQTFAQARNGYFFPYGFKNIVGVGGVDVNLWSLGSLHGTGFRISHISLTHFMQRHSSGIVNSINGDLITAEDLRDLNGNGKSPWGLYKRAWSKSQKWNNAPPPFLRFSYTQHPNYNDFGDTNIQSARAIAQEGHSWCFPSTRPDRNDLPSKAHEQRLAENSHQSGDPYIKPEADHQSRYFGFVNVLSYGANRGWAKYLAVKEGVYAQRCESRFELDSEYSSMNGAYYRTSSSMQECINEINLQGKPNYGGSVAASGVEETSRNRGDGMMAYCVADGFRFSDPNTVEGAAARGRAAAWLDKMAECYSLTLTTYGVGRRNDGTAVELVYDNPYSSSAGMLKYPLHDGPIGDTDIPAREGALPLDDLVYDPNLPAGYGWVEDTGSGANFSLGQGFQACFLNGGVIAAFSAIAQPGSYAWTAMQCSLDFLPYMYQFARASGELRPFNWAIVSEGSGGVGDAPGVGQGPWPGGDIRPGSWKFNSEDYDPAVPYSIPHLLDNRQLLLMSQTMLAMHDSGDTAGLANMVQYAKDFAGTPAGDLDDLLDAMFGATGTNYNGESIAQKYQDEYRRCEFGSIISTVKYLRSIGAIS